MPFSSADWTIPELCVWIVTRSRDALNALAPPARKNLKYADMVHSGAYAARDEVIEAAQKGTLVVSCAGERDRHRSNPGRLKLPQLFWNNAEILDSHAGWMADFAPRLVARRVDRPEKEYDDLLVGSAEAKAIWKPAPSHTEKSASGASPLADAARSREHTAKATQEEHDDWYKPYVKRLQAKGQQSNTPEDEAAARLEPPEGLGDRADRLKVRISRKNHAPLEWQSTAVRRKTSVEG